MDLNLTPPTPQELVQLISESDNLGDLAQQVIFSGTPYVFESDPEVWVRARSQLATSLASNEDNIYIVGSAKMGYSLAPRKFGRPFADDSDIDVVIVDSTLYDTMWASILRWHYRRRHRLPSRDRRWDEERREGLYWGYLEPARFHYNGLSRPAPLRAARKVSSTWFSAFKSLGLIPELAERSLGGRLYRSSTHAILYHDHGLREIRRSMS